MAWQWFEGKWMDSKEVAKTQGDRGIGGAIMMAGALVIGLTVKGIEAIANWSQYTFPAKQIAAWYYFSLYVPVSGAIALAKLPWRFIYTEPLTKYPNLNAVLAVLTIVLIFAAILVALLGAARLLYWFLGRVLYVLLALWLIGPLVFWAIWAIYGWLTAPA